MHLCITSVDYAPESFEAAVPITIKLLRQLPGPDRPDYWLGELEVPFEYVADEKLLKAKYFIVSARWQGTQITPNAENLPINIAVLIDETQLYASQIDFAKSKFIAIGFVNEVKGRTEITAGTIGRFFGTGSIK